jgi:hypothetical protein
MTPMEVRLQALRLAVDTSAPKSEVITVARTFLSFLREDDTPATVTPSEKAVPPKNIGKQYAKA